MHVIEILLPLCTWELESALQNPSKGLIDGGTDEMSKMKVVTYFCAIACLNKSAAWCGFTPPVCAILGSALAQSLSSSSTHLSGVWSTTCAKLVCSEAWVTDCKAGGRSSRLKRGGSWRSRKGVGKRSRGYIKGDVGGWAGGMGKILPGGAYVVEGRKKAECPGWQSE